jgi:transcriptional regulator with XRE-family HTH domain/alkylhydroperoxidase/carboxymuconolactone decarboxylase family protein YurZ
MSEQDRTLGERIRDIRKRRGLSQRELAQLAGVSVSLVRKLEQAERQDARLETVRKIATALRVQTSTLLARPGTIDADRQTVILWEPVRRALFGPAPEPEEAPTVEGVEAALRAVRPAVAANRYAEVSAVLPRLLRDAEALSGDARHVRSRALNLTGWLLVQTRQWEPAFTTLNLAMDAAGDRLDAAAAADTLCWSLLRQGKIDSARALATRWADDIEPRFSRATQAELSMWGRLALRMANTAIRDARPGEAEDATRLAKAAAERIGREVAADESTTRTFGPATVAMIRAENAAINGQPDKVLRIARTIPRGIMHPNSASRRRHQLDIAYAHAQLRQDPAAIGVLGQLRAEAPEWLVQQRYARDILGSVIKRRRTLTEETRELADFLNLAL